MRIGLQRLRQMFGAMLQRAGNKGCADTPKLCRHRRPFRGFIVQVVAFPVPCCDVGKGYALQPRSNGRIACAGHGGARVKRCHGLRAGLFRRAHSERLRSQLSCGFIRLVRSFDSYPALFPARNDVQIITIICTYGLRICRIITASTRPTDVPMGLYVDLLRLTQERAAALDALAPRLREMS